MTRTKSLGMHNDEHLSWNVHIDNLCKKVASGIGALKRIRNFVNSNTLQMIFSSLINFIFIKLYFIYFIKFRLLFCSLG